MLTDEEKRAIRAKVSDASGEWHFDLMMYANEIERAALAKSGEQNYKQDIVVGEVYKSSSTGSSVDCTLFIDFPEGTTKLYAHPLPAQAVPEGWQLVPVEPTDEMLDAAAEKLYGHTRQNAIEWAKE